MNWLLLMILGITQASEPISENFEICAVGEETDFMVCECSNRENFTLGPIFDDISRLTVKGCDTVSVPFAALTNLKLHSLEFFDLKNVLFYPFALSTIHGLSTLKIANIGNLDIRPHAFVGVHNVFEIRITNVTVDTLLKDALSSVTNVQKLIIEDSSFFRVQQLAIAVQDVLNFEVKNSEFTYLDDVAFLLHNASKVEFINCSFGDTMNSSFSFSYVHAVYFRTCRFGKVETMSMQSNRLEIFELLDSVIETWMPDALAGLNVYSQLVFKNNSIQILYDESFISFFAPEMHNFSSDYCCNSFTCDCSLYWMWKENTSLLETSTCINDRSKTLSLFTPKMDSFNNCMTLELKSPGTDISDLLSNVNILPSDGTQLENACMAVFCAFLLVKRALFHFKFGV